MSMPAAASTPAAILLAAILLAAAGLTGCGGDRSARPPKVVCTIAQIGDVTREIAAGRVEVVELMGQGVDPHLYRPTRSDMATLSHADLVLFNGLLLEGKMTDALERIASSGRPVHAVTDAVDRSLIMHPEDQEGHEDPHVWMDPVAWGEVARGISIRLAEIDPDGRATYEANAAAYVERLEALDAWAQSSLASIPEAARVLVTAHDAFRYFGRRYGLEVIGIQGISTESEAGVRHIVSIVDLLVSRNIPAVFIESTVPDRHVRALIAGAQSRGHEVAVGGELFSDAMGRPGTAEGTYIGMIEHNVRTVVTALGGTVADRAGDRPPATDD